MDTKSQVLEALQAKKNEYVSGSQIASHLNISRSAVWKAIKQLRADGYTIEAVTHKGYRITNVADNLHSHIFYHHLMDLGVPREKLLPVYVYRAIDSTITKATFRIADGAPHGTVVIAECLTAGKTGPSSVSYFPPGNLYLSVIYQFLSVYSPSPEQISPAGLVAVIDSLRDLYGIQCSIRDVDNLYYGNQRIGWIITEGSGQTRGGVSTLITGIMGISVFFDRLCISGDRMLLAAHIIKRLIYDPLSPQEIGKKYLNYYE